MSKHNNNKINKHDQTSNDDLQKQLVGVIYSLNNISKFRYEQIQYESHLSKLLRTKFFASINFCGTSCLLVFTKLSGKFYVFTVDRSTLSYNFNKIDYSSIKMDMRTLRLDPTIYMGTIFDGILIKIHGKEDVFVISDVYNFKGIDYTSTKLEDKLELIKDYLRENYDETQIENNIRLVLNRLYPLEKTGYLVEKVMPTIKEFKFRGLCFYPEISECKQIFLFNNEEKTNNPVNKDSQRDTRENRENRETIDTRENRGTRDTRDTRENRESQRERDTKQDFIKFVNTSDKEIIVTLEVRTTTNPDVYNLFCVDRIIEDGKKILKRVNLGTAFIPGIEVSHKLGRIFNTSNTKAILMKCRFNDSKSKFEPLEIDHEAKIPTLLSSIDLDQIED